MAPNGARRIFGHCATFWAELIWILRILFLGFFDLKFPDFQLPDFQISKKSGLGQAWARLEPGQAVQAAGPGGPSWAGGPSAGAGGLRLGHRVHPIGWVGGALGCALGWAHYYGSMLVGPLRGKQDECFKDFNYWEGCLSIAPKKEFHTCPFSLATQSDSDFCLKFGCRVLEALSSPYSELPLVWLSEELSDTNITPHPLHLASNHSTKLQGAQAATILVETSLSQPSALVQREP